MAGPIAPRTPGSPPFAGGRRGPPKGRGRVANVPAPLALRGARAEGANASGPARGSGPSAHWNMPPPTYVDARAPLDRSTRASARPPGPRRAPAGPTAAPPPGRRREDPVGTAWHRPGRGPVPPSPRATGGEGGIGRPPPLVPARGPGGAPDPGTAGPSGGQGHGVGRGGLRAPPLQRVRVPSGGTGSDARAQGPWGPCRGRRTLGLTLTPGRSTFQDP